ncbi:MAG: S8 family serine peptidase [Euryarchaeota archaeon]|nr:S8 family serine peptidase [Euryarchaeota archaeon]
MLVFAAPFAALAGPIAAATGPTGWNFDDGVQGWAATRFVGASPCGTGLFTGQAGLNLNGATWDPAAPAAPGWHLSEFGARDGSPLGWIFDRELFAFYGDCEDTKLDSPSLDLGATPDVQLTFWLRGAVELDFDFMYVLASGNDGASWTQVAEFTGDKGDWAQYTVPLGPASGSASAKVRFHFVSDFVTILPAEGYALDDIAIVAGGGSAGPTVSLTADDRNIDEGSSITYTATVTAGDNAISTATLEFGDGASTSLSAGTTVVSHTYTLPGVYNAEIGATDTASLSDSALLTVTAEETDPYGPRVVVAVVDTGVNPYHETYRRAGVNLPLGDFLNASDSAAPRVVNLNFTNDFGSAVASDAGNWAGIPSHELVYFAGTNVLAISMDARPETVKIRDPQGHGTATTSTVLDAFPGAIIVQVQPETDGTAVDLLTLAEGVEWAAEQPWIDVISISVGAAGNVPLGGPEVPEATKKAYDAGKIIFVSAGNDPSPLPTDSLDGVPWVISVTGTQEGGQGREIMASTVYPDIASNYTVTAADRTSHNATVETGGTSFSCPTAAGTTAGAIYALRAASGYTGGISGGDFVPSMGVGNVEMRAALNKSAYYNDWLETGTVYLAGLHWNGDVGVVPVAPWAEIGWGHIDARSTDDIVAVVQSGDYSIPAPPAVKGLAKPYMEANHAVREAYWQGTSVPVEGPGPELNVVAITPIETPHPYPADANVVWTRTVPGASAVSAHFEDFDVETSFDFASVEDAAGTVFGTYSLEGGLDFWSTYVPGDTLVVRLTSDASVQLNGFVVNEVDAPSA